MSDVLLYSILDHKTCKYGPLMSFVNDSSAIRAFQEMIISKDPNSLIALYPSDYSLMVLGYYENDNGKITSLPAPNLIITGLQAIDKAVATAESRRSLERRLQGIETEILQADESSVDAP